MDRLTQSVFMGASGTEPLYVDDVFSTYLYEGNGVSPSSTKTITNGIDLSGEGGLVWIKNRFQSYNNVFTDTERGATQQISSNQTDGQQAYATGLTSFNSTGFSLGNNGQYNDFDTDHVSWTFRKAPGFFDVVTWTGTGSAQTIAHNLGSVPGCIIVKRTDTTSNWAVYHRSLGIDYRSFLNLTDQSYSASVNHWDNTNPTATSFSVRTHPDVNASGGTYVAYIFAHDDQSFGTDGDESIIQCGTFSNTGFVNLGWEPQWIMIKPYTQTYNWQVFDNRRGMSPPDFNIGPRVVYPNLADAETGGSGVLFESTGFTQTTFGPTYPCIYIAIRRPHKPPEAGTDVFKSFAWTGNGTSQDLTVSFAPDFMHVQGLNIATTPHFIDILRGKSEVLVTSATDNEYTTSTLGILEFYEDGAVKIGSNSTFNAGSYTYAGFSLKRAPGFFDMVAYTGDGTTGRNIAHNLGVTPELIILKSTNGAGTNWYVNATPYTTWANGYPTGFLNLTDAITGNTTTGIKNPTSTSFEVNHANTNTSNSGFNKYIAYLFASLTGISKVGSYSGTGNDINVDCGFTAGARFVLIKRTDSTGDWYWWDSVRGINAGNDPYARFNVNDTEVTNTDYIDPINSGFTVTSSAPAELNTNGGTYIFLAIA